MQRNGRFFEISLKTLVPYFPFVFFASLFVIGLLVGCLLVGNFYPVSNLAENIFNSLFFSKQNSTFALMFGNSIIKTIPVYLVLFLIGTSIVGCICAPFLLVSFGFLYGIISGYLYINFSLEGIMYNCLILMPTLLIVVFGLIILSIEAFNFSVLLSKACIKFSKPINIFLNFKRYCFKSITILICALIGIFFDICLTYLFVNYFSFL